MSGWGSAAHAADYLDRSVLVPLAQTIVRIEASGADGRLQIGTGVTIAPGLVVTNCHVTNRAVRVRVLKREASWNVISQHADDKHDLCYLRSPSWPGRPVRFADPAEIRLHQQVAAMGYTGGVDLSISDGEISDMHRFDGERIIRTTAGFTSGASGGALVDAQGSLIGVLTFRLPGRGSRNFALPAQWIQQFLARSDPTFEPIGPMPNLRAFWQEEAERLPYFMRAELLEVAGRWKDLADTADDWQRDDPESGEPWVAKGKAMIELGRPDAAVRSFQRAIGVAPRNPLAWFGLGSASLRLTDSAQADQALAQLESLDPILAERLDAMIVTARKQR